MKWWSNKSVIPKNDERFYKMIEGFVFECPSSHASTSKIKGSKTVYRPVSARGVTFRERGIQGGYLLTILSKIKNPLVINNSYIKLSTKESVVSRVEECIKSSSLGDKFFDLIVFHERSNMSDTESIYYYIRNAFAHGRFEIINHNDSRIYLLENKHKDVIKAQIRLKEKTLLRYIKFSKYSVKDIKTIRKNK